MSSCVVVVVGWGTRRGQKACDVVIQRAKSKAKRIMMTNVVVVVRMVNSKNLVGIVWLECLGSRTANGFFMRQQRRQGFGSHTREESTMMGGFDSPFFSFHGWHLPITTDTHSIAWSCRCLVKTTKNAKQSLHHKALDDTQSAAS